MGLAAGLRILRLAIDTHLITSHATIPLLIVQPGGLVIEVTDGNAEFNAEYRGTIFYDLAKVTPHRIALALAKELGEYGATAVSLSPATRSNRWPTSTKVISGRRRKPLSRQRRSPRRPSLCPSRSKP